MSLHDSSSDVAGDESTLVPVCGRPGVVVVEVFTESSCAVLTGDEASSLKYLKYKIKSLN